MIARISGTLVEKHPPQVVVMSHGVGYEMQVPMSTFYNLPRTGDMVELLTHLVVREDAHLLYGFFTANERAAFRELLKVNGVGPKVALAVLSGLSVDDLAMAVAAEDAGRLTKVPGVGRKTADRLVLELRGRLPNAVSSAPGSAAPASSDVLNALLALGYNDREAQAAVKQLPADLPLDDSIRQALKYLART